MANIIISKYWDTPITHYERKGEFHFCYEYPILPNHEISKILGLNPKNCEGSTKIRDVFTKIILS